jgi:PAS domain S-box-containing protein
VDEMMENEFKQIGQEIMERCNLLNQKVLEKQKSELNILHIEIQSYIHKSFFHCLGDSIFHDEKTAYEKIKEWAEILQEETDFSRIKIQPSLFPIHLYKSVILDLMEEEINSNNISPNILIQVLKKIDSFIHYASTFFSGNSNQKFSNNKNISVLSIEDNRITIQELTDLKNALKEATILTVTDNEDIIKYANEKFCHITKYSSEELVGQNHHNLLYSGHHDDEFFQEIRNAIKQGKVWKGEIKNKAKDGSYYWADTTIVPFLDRNGETYQHISIEHDITDQKIAEDMLHKTEKLSLVGELAAGIAHEIRNPLTTIRGFVQILDYFSEEKKLLYSKTILEEIDRINFIVSEFMVFAKPHAVNFNDCNILEIVKNVIHFLGAEAAMKDVEFIEDFHLDDIFIYGERNQLSQVFLNIIKNSIDALPKGGQIKILCKLYKNRVLVSIKDNGIGMTKAQVHKIGEPFYTTKEKGNGLGLMVSYKIIENHSGRIIVESELNKGTTFKITFPHLSIGDTCCE